MNPENLAYIVGSGWLSGRLLVFLLESIAINTYSLQRVRYQKIAKAKKIQSNPGFTVVIPIQGSCPEINNCLNSILNCRYSKLKILIINHGADKKTLSTIKRFNHKNKKLKLQIKKSAANAINWQLMSSDYYGTYKLHLSADIRLDQKFFDRAAMILTTGYAESASQLSSHTKSEPKPSVISLVQQFENSRQNVMAMIWPSGVYHKSPSIKPIKNHKKPTIHKYADDLVAYSPPYSSMAQLINSTEQSLLVAGERFIGHKTSPAALHSKLITGFSELIRLMEPVAIGYFIYLAVAHERPQALAIAWILLILSLLSFVWADSQSKLSQKAKLSMLAPMITGPLYLLSLTRIVAVTHIVLRAVKRDLSNWQDLGIATK